jgi:hypothetical protein
MMGGVGSAQVALSALSRLRIQAAEEDVAEPS